LSASTVKDKLLGPLIIDLMFEIASGWERTIPT
jgi:hypothetical protein